MSFRPTGRHLTFRSAVLAAVLLALGACDDDEVAPLAWLVGFEGAVRIDRGEDAEGGATDAPLYDGNWVSTGASSRATIRYSDRTQIEIGENSRVRIGGRDGRLTLEFERGTLLSNTRQVGAGGVLVLTKYGRLQLLQGSEIQFTLSEDGRSTMDVLSGSIELLGEDGGSMALLEGETLDFVLGTRSTRGGADGGTDGSDLAQTEALPIQMVVAAPRGKASLRAAGEKSFAAAPVEEAPISPGTELRVAKGGSATVRGRGLEGRFGAASGAVIGAASLLGEEEQYGLSIERGATELAFTHRGARTVSLKSRGREAVLQSQDLGAVGVAVTRRGLEFVVRAGKVTLTAGGQTRALTTGERVVLTGNVLGPTQRLTAQLSLPHSRRVRVYADGLEHVSLQLPKHEGRARLEVARDAGFGDRLLVGVVEDEQVVVPAPAGGELHWRLLADDDRELGKGHARFYRDGGRSVIDLDNPKAEVKETGLKATVLFQSVPPSLTFSFAEKPGAAAYRVRVFKSSDLKKPVAEKVVTETQSTFEAGKLREGEYLWNATPLSASGAEISGGRMNRLELLYDNSRTSLAIARPRMNEVVSSAGRGIPVEGIAPVGSKLFVNGRPAGVDPKGRFATTVPRANTLVFRLITDNGAEGYWVRRLRSSR